MDRPGWEAGLKSLEPGDIPVIHSLERLEHFPITLVHIESMQNPGGVLISLG
jgi:hypothetical protein